jgi:signal transduction histidine kinase
MRLGLKSTFLLLAGYAVLVTAFALGLNRWLRGFEAVVIAHSARLVAGEKLALLADRSADALLLGDPASRSLLHERIQDIALLSEVVSSISVRDADGKVVASDTLPVGQLGPAPSVLFGSGRLDVRARGPERFLNGGDYVVDLPLQQEGRLIGYVEIALHDERLAGLYRQAQNRLLIATLAGLGGVLALGAVLQLQIRRRASSIARTLEEAIDPRPAGLGPRQDEFGRALQAAGRVKHALHEARRETSRLQASFGALARAFKMGVLILRRGHDVDFANARALELFGVPSLEALRPLWPRIEKEMGPLFAALGANGHAERPLTTELPGDQGPRRLRLELYRLGDQNHDEYLALVNDPEILEALETDMRLARQLEGLARVYRTAAHELRAPLSAMMINLDLLRESLAESRSPDPAVQDSQERYVSVLREELERLNRSLAEVLTQAAPPSDQRARFDLRDAVSELGTLLAGQALRQRVELATRLPSTPVFLIGYRDRLKQALLNIAVNALEAMPNGGKMGIDMDLEDARVRVAISDTGPGIAADLLTRIYEREFTTKGGGSGIGLYVARTLVELHGGEISVKSEEGAGTRVEVALPVVPGD